MSGYHESDVRTAYIRALPERDGTVLFQAVCDCDWDWQGPERATREEALDDAAEHDAAENPGVSADPLSVDCPTCGQARGFDCRNVHAFYKPTKHPHPSRVAKAREA